MPHKRGNRRRSDEQPLINSQLTQTPTLKFKNKSSSVSLETDQATATWNVSNLNVYLSDKPRLDDKGSQTTRKTPTRVSKKMLKRKPEPESAFSRMKNYIKWSAQIMELCMKMGVQMKNTLLVKHDDTEPSMRVELDELKLQLQQAQQDIEWLKAEVDGLKVKLKVPPPVIPPPPPPPPPPPMSIMPRKVDKPKPQAKPDQRHVISLDEILKVRLKKTDRPSTAPDRRSGDFLTELTERLRLS